MVSNNAHSAFSIPKCSNAVRWKVLLFFVFLKGCLNSHSRDQTRMHVLVCISLEQKEMLSNRERRSKMSLIFPTLGVIQQLAGEPGLKLLSGKSKLRIKVKAPSQPKMPQGCGMGVNW